MKIVLSVSKCLYINDLDRLLPCDRFFVHLDYKKAHYIKLVLDEIFGERNLVNEIIWAYTGP